MQGKLKFIRRSKFLFYRLALHKIFLPFNPLYLNLAYLSKLSKFIHSQKNIPYNDFYSHKWDYSKRYTLYEKIFEHEKLDGAVNYMEFGVAKGLSFKWWLDKNQNADSRFYGFDTFTGLPEDWGPFKAGDMSTGDAVPQIEDNRGKFIKGLFQDTLPDFLKNLDNSKRKIIHLDADLFTSTMYVLGMFAPYLKSGDILIFDEFAVPKHEFLAFTNFVDAYRVNYEIIAAYNNFFFVAVKLK
jgi:O-methyltransferase